MGTAAKKDMEKRIKEMAKDIAKDEKAHISLDEALREGWVILPQDAQKMVEEAVVSHEKKIRDDIEKELKNKYAKVNKEVREKTITSYLIGTGLTSHEFAKRLIKLNVNKKYASVLRDEHFKLNDKALWALIRDNYKA